MHTTNTILQHGGLWRMFVDLPTETEQSFQTACSPVHPIQVMEDLRVLLGVSSVILFKKNQLINGGCTFKTDKLLVL